MSAATGTASDGWMSLSAPAVQSRVSWPLAVLLLVIGPVGWGVFLLLCMLDRGETLDVTLPWTEQVHDEVVALRGRRLAAWLICAAGTVGAVVATRASAGGTLTAQALTLAGAVVALGACVAALHAGWKMGRRTPGVALDASRRWVTLSNVAPGFVTAVERDQTQRRSAQPA